METYEENINEYNEQYHYLFKQSLKYNWDEPLSYPFEKSNTSLIKSSNKSELEFA
mgnify:CR=1 FL=1